MASTKASKTDAMTEKSNNMSNDLETNPKLMLSSKYKKNNQEVSRKGNGMGGSGWKSQFCMNGISFCFKVGTLLRATGMFFAY